MGVLLEAIRFMIMTVSLHFTPPLSIQPSQVACPHVYGIYDAPLSVSLVPFINLVIYISIRL